MKSGVEKLRYHEIIEDYSHLLDDIDRKKIKKIEEKMERAPFEREKLELEKKIYEVCLDSFDRKGVHREKDLSSWLGEEDQLRINDVVEKVKQSRDVKESLKYEAKVYGIYLESICSQTVFPLESLVKKYIRLLEDSETSEESAILSLIITDLLETAR